MDAMQMIVQLFLAIMVCVACVFAGLTFKITSSLLSYTAIKIKGEPRGYFVTYMVVKDHDFRNEHLKIPHLERIRQGYEFRYGSELLLFGDDETPIMAPTYLKMRILDNLADRDEVSRLDLFCVVPMSGDDIAGEHQYMSELNRQTLEASQASKETQEPNK